MKSSLSRPTLARFAVGVTALVAGAFTIVPAQADEVPGGPDVSPSEDEAPAAVVTTSPVPSTTTPSPVETTDAEPDGDEPSDVETTIPTPTITTTSPSPTSPSPTATTSSPTPPVEEGEEEVEPIYGFQKFRVAVKPADGTSSTVGTQFRVTISEGDFTNAETFDCTTVATEPPSPDGTTFCPGDELELPARTAGALARASSVGTTPGTDDRYAYIAPPGARVSVTQLNAGRGLVRTAAAGGVTPCPAAFPVPICFTGDAGDPLSSTVLFVNDRVRSASTGTGTDADPDDDVAGEDEELATSDDALPDTGASSEGGSPAPWLGALMLAGGAAVIGRELRPKRVSKR